MKTHQFVERHFGQVLQCLFHFFVFWWLQIRRQVLRLVVVVLHYLAPKRISSTQMKCRHEGTKPSRRGVCGAIWCICHDNVLQYAKECIVLGEWYSNSCGTEVRTRTTVGSDVDVVLNKMTGRSERY